MKFGKFLIKPFFTEHLRWLLVFFFFLGVMFGLRMNISSGRCGRIWTRQEYFLTLCYIITGKCLQPVFFCFFYLNVTVKHYFQEYLCQFFKRFSMKTPCLRTWMIIFFIFKLLYFKLVLISQFLILMSRLRLPHNYRTI